MTSKKEANYIHIFKCFLARELAQFWTHKLNPATAPKFIFWTNLREFLVHNAVEENPEYCMNHVGSTQRIAVSLF